MKLTVATKHTRVFINLCIRLLLATELLNHCCLEDLEPASHDADSMALLIQFILILDTALPLKTAHLVLHSCRNVSHQISQTSLVKRVVGESK